MDQPIKSRNSNKDFKSCCSKQETNYETKNIEQDQNPKTHVKICYSSNIENNITFDPAEKNCTICEAVTLFLIIFIT